MAVIFLYQIIYDIGMIIYDVYMDVNICWVLLKWWVSLARIAVAVFISLCSVGGVGGVSGVGSEIDVRVGPVLSWRRPPSTFSFFLSLFLSYFLFVSVCVSARAGCFPLTAPGAKSSGQHRLTITSATLLFLPILQLHPNNKHTHWHTHTHTLGAIVSFGNWIPGRDFFDGGPCLAPSATESLTGSNYSPGNRVVCSAFISKRSLGDILPARDGCSDGIIRHPGLSAPRCSSSGDFPVPPYINIDVNMNQSVLFLVLPPTAAIYHCRLNWSQRPADSSKPSM